MCLSIPHKVVSLKGQKAKVECGKKTHTLDIRLVPKAKVGDYLLSENQFAVYKVSKEDALETLKFLNG